MSEEEKNKYLDLEKFNYNKDDLFGHYAEIEMEFYGPEGNRIHLFKIISSGIQSNFYNDLPFNHHTKPAYIHKEMADIVKVVECGINEEKIYRVPIKDIKILPTKQDKELETYKKIAEKLAYKLAEKDTYYDYETYRDENLTKPKVKKYLDWAKIEVLKNDK